MYRFTFVLLAIMAVGAYGGSITPRQTPEVDGRIVGGKDASINNFPYQVSVRYRGSHFCGGAIINSRVIVTAAHCIVKGLKVSRYYSVLYGSTDVDSSKNVIAAERLLKNKNYDPSNTNYDIALIYLVSDIKFSANAQPITLATKAPAAGTPAIVTGWGTMDEEGKTSPSILQQVTVKIVSKAQCQLQHNGIADITPQMLCAGVPQGGKDACGGDSGGPLVANGKLVGIVSWGVGCGRTGYSGIYSNVAALSSWIEENSN